MTRPAKEVNEMYVLYQSGKSFEQVGKIYGISSSTIAGIFHRRKLYVRSRLPGLIDVSNPQNGDIAGSRELGKARRGKYIYLLCPNCHAGHWVRLYMYQHGTKGYCRRCYGVAVGQSNTGKKRNAATKSLLSKQKKGKLNPQWQGGVFRNTGDYVKEELCAID